MLQFLDPLLIVALALNFVALGVSRIRAVINAVALQGILLGVFPLLLHHDLGFRGYLLVAATVVLKGFIIPRFLFFAMREADIQHEVKPVINYMTSLLLGAVGTGLAVVFSSTLELTEAHTDLLVVPASLATVWTGFLMLTTRKKAIMQVLGYLLLENGIFLFGLLLLEAMPFLVEVGVLLDLFTGVFVMGIIIHHISREFASTGTEHLAELKEQPMIYLPILFPLAMAALTYAVPSNRWRPWLLPLGGAGHLALVALMMVQHAGGERMTGLDGSLQLDALGQVVLGLISVLFFLCSLYAPAYLALRADRPNRVFCANLLFSLSMMTLVTLSHHLGLMWVAMEATTLASAPSIYFNHNARSLEATWKYLLIGSVGIALALLGSFFLAYSALKANLETTLLFDQLIHDAKDLNPGWLHAAFVLLFIGYGTKMGLAPMHTWKPDAYGEAPGVVGTLLAGGVTSCAFLAILRVYQICRAGAEAEFAREIMIFMGLLSMAVAAVFMVRQRDFKRMLAYSSVEHMGILVLGIGIGGRLAVYGALLHLINNGLTKGVMFLSAGNIHRAYGSKLTDHVHGAIQRVPVSGALFLAGFLAITGSPPFGPFVSEFTIVNAAFLRDHFVAGGLFLLLLGIVFIGMGATVLAVVQGKAPEQSEPNGYHDSPGTVVPILLFMALVLCLGLYIPPPLEALLREAAALVEGTQ